MARRWKTLSLLAAVLAAAGYGYWRLTVPEHRVAIRSELVMLGDLDGDHRWTAGDLKALDSFLEDPFASSGSLAWRIDLNQNGLIDEEDVRILRTLVSANGDPYAAEASVPRAFPRPRELYRYASLSEYHPRPLWALPYPPAHDSVLRWLDGFQPSDAGPYAHALDLAIRDEAIRFDYAYRRREAGLLPIEREYAARKIARLVAPPGARTGAPSSTPCLAT